MRADIAEECLQFGYITNILLFMLEKYEKTEDAVRLFIECNDVEHAIKIYMNLKERIFGGKNI